MTARPASRVTVREVAPALDLREFVRSYHYTVMSLTTPILTPLTARPELMMQFAVRQRFSIVDHASGTISGAPDVVFVGRQTRRNIDLAASGELATFTVHFQPAGFYGLFGMPMVHVTDLTLDAEDVLGTEIRAVNQQVQASSTPYEMVAHVESLLRKRARISFAKHPVESAATVLLASGSAADLGSLAAGCGLSVRQFERAFVQRVGVSPKLFARIVRFASAVQAKRNAPRRSWADIAAHTGYYDQMHLIRDCRGFSGMTPTALLDVWMDCRP